MHLQISSKQQEFMDSLGENREGLNVRIVLIVIFFLFSFSFEGEARQGEPFQFSVVPHAGSERVEFELLIKNNEETPLQFEFPTSQFYEITVTDLSGNEVYRYSKGRFFLQAIQNLKIEPHQTYRNVESWDYKVNGKRVPAGEYTVSATLLSRKLNDKPFSNNEALVSKMKFTLP
jgi:Intracellular proteinase inhibitor